jgi:hypothetical protein
MDMTAQNLTARELDSRTTNGISVRLLWHEPDGRLFVAVADAKTGDAFNLEVRDRERALDVFLHPYSYVARYRVDTHVTAATGVADSSTSRAG